MKMNDEDGVVEHALMTLAENGIALDILELLVRGNPALGVAPGAMQKALEAACAARQEEQPFEDRWDNA